LIVWLKKVGSFLRSYREPKTSLKLIDAIINHIEGIPSIEQPTWISCAERLPTYGERVLAAVCGNVETLTLYYRDLLIEDYWEDDVQRVIRLGAVTHWMPLPRPPKGDE
jgi:hypothetical protein